MSDLFLPGQGEGLEFLGQIHYQIRLHFEESIRKDKVWFNYSVVNGKRQCLRCDNHGLICVQTDKKVCPNCKGSKIIRDYLEFDWCKSFDFQAMFLVTTKAPIVHCSGRQVHRLYLSEAEWLKDRTEYYSKNLIGEKIL